MFFYTKKAEKTFIFIRIWVPTFDLPGPRHLANTPKPQLRQEGPVKRVFFKKSLKSVFFRIKVAYN